ncbi:Rne/Rng family ribonuclease [Salinisphaera sp.]|uniref:Rne/Rng family ribonuclease n=1 Tax=Salinisphaera sp. TaxID=1914330 RepID=UPI002D78933E|nr:Rne/Rng family ribonuclease [Salinisphaera sp.]HET7313120.1 Rne/Rng family ribonuclease [Salinisphaera sp.]
MSSAEPLIDADALRVEILVNAGPGETRAAQIERGVLQDIHIQRDATASAVSNIYLGVVQRVLAGMQAAFIDIGAERAAFLQVSDMVRPDTGDDADTPRIEKRLHAGDRVLVQVTRDAMGTKGARLTTDLAIPSRFLVYMPHTPRIGVSARIESEEERSRLFEAVSDLRRELDLPGGFIVRTVADGAAPTALAADMRFLATVWADIRSQAEHVPGETLIYGDLPLAIRMLRDLLTPEVSAVIIDDARAWNEMIAFTRRFAPEFTDRVLMHEGDTPLFAQYGIEDAIQRALQPRVPLKSGGFLIIEQTEAMITVDVNTGGFVGTRSLEQTVLRTNLEAAQTVARQLRLRNLGGIIVIDFIDMIDAEHKQQVLAQLTAALAADPAKTAIGPLSNLGLVEVTRKRTRESLEHLLCAPCEACGGRGYVKTPETIAFDLFREIARRAWLRPRADAELLVLAPPDTIDQLLDGQAGAFRRVCDDAGVIVRLQAEALYGPEQFDVVVM